MVEMRRKAEIIFDTTKTLYIKQISIFSKIENDSFLILFQIFLCQNYATISLKNK